MNMTLEELLKMINEAFEDFTHKYMYETYSSQDLISLMEILRMNLVTKLGDFECNKIEEMMNDLIKENCLEHLRNKNFNN